MSKGRLSREEIEARLKDLDGWRLEGNYIVREYETENWKRGVFLLNAVAGIAEARWHHPDVELSFKKLKIKLTTHEAGGITEKDFLLASEVETLVRRILEH
jgi:4a-hydroxytetrahydrobiopterin dehydratase